ncbi:MAG: sugar ABC transporter permease [Treponema sp.]|nr:sugar ABC transporter permease [Treponema sp.]MBR4630250.1 sugar ABC transporter permease [Treponema sp.]MBR6914182.1 sugar ABC transporter permease [Treponema sp.]MCR5126012.1 sugar ABC transporter permease [Treponema sp.]
MDVSKKSENVKKRKGFDFNKWGYFFIAPFFIIFTVFSLIPLISTFANSLFENYRDGLQQIGPRFVGLANFVEVFKSDILRYLGNTFIIWMAGFIPQITISLILSVWLTSSDLRIKAKQFFKTVIYMPNLIMASAFAMLFFTIFSDNGPANSILLKIGFTDENIRFLSSQTWTRGLVGAMNFLMWYGNTTILLMAGIMGIDESIFEAAKIDGASPLQVFFKITMPMLMPIFVYVLITSLIGGIQMFDVPQILTNGEGNPNRTSMTLIMYLNKHLANKNYGMAGAVSVLTFALTSVFSFTIYAMTMKKYKNMTGGRK